MYGDFSSSSYYTRARGSGWPLESMGYETSRLGDVKLPVKAHMGSCA